MPSGEVTLMFTDIEGSTRRWDQYQDIFNSALHRHNDLMERAVSSNRGYVVKTIGDSYMVAFSEPLDAALCALDMQRLIEAGSFNEVGGMRIRIGFHTADIEPQGGDYYGPPVNHAARIEASAHGGQIVLSEISALRIQNQLPDGARLIDCELHRMKDLSAPIRLFLLSHEDLPDREYPPLRTLDFRPHNFPAEVTSFIGRGREIEELKALLLNQKKRLVTLTGPSGTGKTRLAMQAGAEMIQNYPDGVWMINLLSITGAREVPYSIALALQIKLSNDGDPRGQIIAHLQEKRCLLILDNFEHVIDAARFMSGLLLDCPHTTCLVTSQHLLQISGEHEYPLDPLELPPLDVSLSDISRYSCLQLFIERAKTARANFSLTEENIGTVAEICNRLDGLPLAVELTAALARGMTPQQILPRLKDRFKLLASSRRDLDPRQRSLRGAIDWSYELLNEDEKSLFSELSVFAGDFNMDAVEQVCETPGCFELVYDLRDKSLLRATESGDEIRYSMLSTLREYAQEHLQDENLEESLKRRHAEYYLSVARKHSPRLLGSMDQAKEATTILEKELPNLRQGMNRSVQVSNQAMVVEYGSTISRFLQRRGFYDECEERLVQAESAARACGDVKSLAMLLSRHGSNATDRMKYEDAERMLQESYEIGSASGDKNRMLHTKLNLGNIAWGRSQFEQAQTLWQEALLLAEETDQTLYQAVMHDSLGIIADWRGNDVEAVEHFESSLRFYQRDSYEEYLAFALCNYASHLIRTKQFENANEMLEKAYSIFSALNNTNGIACAASCLANNAIERGDLTEARSYTEKSLKLAQQSGLRRQEMYALLSMTHLEWLDHRVEEAIQILQRSFQIAQQVGDRKHIADILYLAASLLERDNCCELAYLLVTVAAREYEQMELCDIDLCNAFRSRLQGTMTVHLTAELDARATILSPVDSFALFSFPCIKEF